ncbi:acyl-ACP--UDP-N- acetylglucosamine O-acyltransferase [Rhodococcus sp. H29-C3]|uniref:acyl-ACP--UDP-N- acetylglucosamine O-acyltransferase n=1 Tax=Rhodococcus sp. H29-C3 TaxID=3046307 RepID=UPI0024BAA9DA|nr:acyl-ACP--UDP-N- acetylglucosamine O-acyltransferase [Rhodococcus sp. H29-C3]MDJ0359728.1 acyl-ACP--UDP-N- acetylglucosamine O-acyltransferase [Rhodococcus sp. H29-C3]
MSASSVGSNCQIHETAIIGDGVRIGDRVTIGPYAVLTGPLEVGDDCWIGAQTVLGAPPEIYGHPHFASYTEASDGFGVTIGPRTVIRELTAVHKGSERPTTIGSDSFIMNRISVGHDCQLGDGTIAAPAVTFGGHVTLGAGCNMGMNSTIHQRRVMGSGAMVGMGGIATKDVPPFATVVGNPAVLHSANTVGMSRKGYDSADIDAIAAAYSEGSLPAFDELSETAAQAFAWWNGLVTKPLLT